MWQNTCVVMSHRHGRYIVMHEIRVLRWKCQTSHKHCFIFSFCFIEYTDVHTPIMAHVNTQNIRIICDIVCTSLLITVSHSTTFHPLSSTTFRCCCCEIALLPQLYEIFCAIDILCNVLRLITAFLALIILACLSWVSWPVLISDVCAVSLLVFTSLWSSFLVTRNNWLCISVTLFYFDSSLRLFDTSVLRWKLCIML